MADKTWQCKLFLPENVLTTKWFFDWYAKLIRYFT